MNLALELKQYLNAVLNTEPQLLAVRKLSNSEVLISICKCL